ncbi:hypothetical protein DFH09DRAFT_1093169 [Mycena vulgaris]|nr:hypothetical protein DFH09DRAFT_1093169 [Mycena vulgaris]
MWITLSSVAGCDMIKRGPLQFQKGENRGGLEDCVQSDEWRRVECGIKTIPSLAILSCIFRGALQENLISKNEAIDRMLKISGRNNISKWTSNYRDLYGIILMGNPVSHCFHGKSSTSSKAKTERSAGRTIHEEDVHERGEIQGTDNECIDSARKSGPAAEEKPEAKTRRRASARFRDRNSALPQKKKKKRREGIPLMSQ